MELVDYFARSSIASIFSPPLRGGVDLSGIPSAFQRRVVERDLKKQLVPRLLQADFDLLLIDFIDERFRLWVAEDGGVCTLSNEFLSSGFDVRRSKGAVLKPGSEGHWQLWESGWTSLVALLRSHGLLGRVRINEVSWAKQTESGDGFEPHYSSAQIDVANEFLRRIHRRVAQDIPKTQFLHYPRPFVGADAHQWGRSPFHYLDDYYVHTLNCVLKKDRPDVTIEERSQSKDTTGPTDYAAWNVPIHEHESLESALAADLMIDGIHRVFSESTSIDFLVQGSGLLGEGNLQRVLLVCFAGAVSDRTTHRAPFFSGRGIASNLNQPLIAVADPTLSSAADVALGWYAGNEEVPDLRNRIARVLDHVATKHGCRLVLFGGSGGGFAVMSILRLLKTDAVGVVWNPQTSITEYSQDVVRKYVATAFPGIWRAANEDRACATLPLKSILRRCLDTAGVVHDVTQSPAECRGSLLYLQNANDWHVQKHTAPFMKGNSWQRIGHRSFRRADAPFTVWMGAWGEGHVPPPAPVIRRVLTELVSGTPVQTVARLLDAGVGKSLPPYKRSALDGDIRPSISVRVADGKVEACCDLPPALPNQAQFEYAYYLMAGVQRLAVRWYSANPSATFELPKEATGVRVIGFVRDGMGTVVQSSVAVSVTVEGPRNDPHARHQIVRASELPPDEAIQAKAYWSTIDASQHGTYTARQPWSGEVTRLVKAMGASKVFEFGCNAGKNLAALIEDIPDIFVAGVDINGGAIELARSKGLNAAMGDERSLSLFPDRCFDVVFTVSVLDHIPDASQPLIQLARMSSKAVVLLEPWLGQEGKVVRNFNAKLAQEIDTTPYSYSWDYEKLAKDLLPGWRCESWPLPISTNLGAYYRVYSLTREPGADSSSHG
ncbi:MAG: hypothetical protein JWP65_1731 [Ramlibacter sp.]|nr:hypothetical protein [Ramlibacter sp.]